MHLVNAPHLQRSLELAERGGLLAWTAAAWVDYLSWQWQDRRQLKRINQLIQACRYHYRRAQISRKSRAIGS